MKVLALALAAVFCCSVALSQKRPKPPDVEVVECKALRNDGKILIDGRARASATKALRGLIVYFDLLNPENGVVGTQNVVLEEDRLEPEQERAWHSETSDHVRAVRYRIRATDRDKRELRVANDGPFPIEDGPAPLE